MNSSKSKEDKYAFQHSIGIMILALKLTEMENDEERKKKKKRIIVEKRKLLEEAFEYEFSKGNKRYTDLYNTLTSRKWNQEDAIKYLIDLAFANPFAPYEIRFKEDQLHRAMGHVGKRLGLSVGTYTSIIKTKKEALSVHKKLDYRKITLLGVGGLVLFGFGGYLAAPVIGTAIGTAAGLSGAAATSHGLAILGGGSLAINGAGMAGGMWMVTGTAATIGLLGTGGGGLLTQLGTAGAKVELIKLQISYKEVLLKNRINSKKAETAIKKLSNERIEVEASLAQERELNEKNSERIRNIEDTVKAVNNALKWMIEEKKKLAA